MLGNVFPSLRNAYFLDARTNGFMAAIKSTYGHGHDPESRKTAFIVSIGFSAGILVFNRRPLDFPGRSSGYCKSMPIQQGHFLTLTGFGVGY